MQTFAIPHSANFCLAYATDGTPLTSRASLGPRAGAAMAGRGPTYVFRASGPGGPLSSLSPWAGDRPLALDGWLWDLAAPGFTFCWLVVTKLDDWFPKLRPLRPMVNTFSYNVAFTSDHRRFYYQSRDELVCVRIPEEEVGDTTWGFGTHVRVRLKLSPDDRTLAGQEDGTAIALRPLRGRKRRMAFLHEEEVLDFAFAPDGSWLVATTPRHFHVWDTATGQRVGLIPAGRYVGAVAVHPGGRWLAAAHPHGVAFWDRLTGRELRSYDWGIRPTGLAFGPDGLTAAVRGVGGKIIVWDLDL